MPKVSECREIICDLCRVFYDQGWVSGTGGGITIKSDDGNIVMAPSGVQKERLIPSDMYVLDAEGEKIVEEPKANPKTLREFKLTECAPLFLSAYKHRNAGAVIHSHSINCVMATLIDEASNEFKITEIEMIKGIAGHGYYDNCIVPIIENTARESELTDRLTEAILKYPKSNAVLVRRHGVYVWGKDWIQAKTQIECYDYLFKVAYDMYMLKMNRLILSQSLPNIQNLSLNNGNKKAHVINLGRDEIIVLDIEGTLCPIDFVTNKMYPYALSNANEYLMNTFHTEKTKLLIEEIRKLDKDIIDENLLKHDCDKEKIIDQIIQWMKMATKSNLKIPALKNLQGQIWEKGFEEGHLTAPLFEDVPNALKRWTEKGIKIYIYSSGSHKAQNLFFKHTNYGDMRKYISGYFDAETSGSKINLRSYENIAYHFGVDDPNDIHFVTDILGEAKASYEANWKPTIIIREGNAEISEKHNFPIVTCLDKFSKDVLIEE